jgi:predicted transposase YbfD/YdcC
LTALGFKDATAPCVGTLHFALRHPSAGRFEACLVRWANQVLATQASGAAEALATDGKTLRGSQKGGAPGAHLLAAVSQRLGLTLAQCAVPHKSNELTVMPDLLEGLLLSGRIITADALHTQRSFAQAVLDADGDYVLIAKENQPQLCDDIRTLFQEPQVVRETLTQATSVDLGHGRIEVRGHWRIENRLHWVRDVTFDEDRSTVRCGSTPQVMVALRNTAIALARLAGHNNIAAACRQYAARPWAALALLGIHPEN